MFDFKSFKKIQEDNNKAVLQHPEGHTIHIAKAALSKPLQKQLAALPLHQADPQDAIPAPNPVPNETAIDASKEVLANDQYPAVPTAEEPPQLESHADYTAEPVIPESPVQRDEMASAEPPPDPFANQPGYAEQLAGKKAEAGAIAAQGQQEAKLLGQNAQVERKALADIQASLGAKANEINGVVQDIRNGHINPRQYLDKRSTGSKIATAIGLLAGGMSSARTGVNPAMNFLQSQIDRDLAAQKFNIQRKDTLLNALQAQYKDSAVADSMFRTIRAHTLATQLEQAAATAKTPMAAAQLQQYAGQLKQQYYPQLLQSHIISTLSGPQGSEISPATNLALRQRAGLIDPATYKQATDELGKAQQIENLRSDLKDSFHDLDQKILGGRLSPHDRQSAIQAFAGAITHITEGRVQGEMAQQQARALLPDIGESEDTRNRKFQRIDQLANTFKTTPVLDGLGIKVAPTPVQQHPVTGKSGKEYIQQGNMMVPFKRD